VGLAANPVVDGHVNDSFLTNALQGSLNGEFFTQDEMSVIEGRMPRLDSTDEIALTPGIARLFGVGIGGKVTYQLYNVLGKVLGYSTYRVTAIVDYPPVLVDQFDQVEAAILPPGATARLSAEVAFSWVGLRLEKGRSGIAAIQSDLTRLAAQVGDGYTFAARSLDTVHQQVQEAIRPQAVALGVFGGLTALALVVLVGQALAQLVDNLAAQSPILRAVGLTRTEVALAQGLGGTLAVAGGMALGIAGAFALSPLGPVGPVRQFDPARGPQFDITVLLGGGAVLLALLLALLARLAWRSVRPVGPARSQPRTLLGRAAGAVRLPTVGALGARFALEPPPQGRRATVSINLVGSVAAVAAVVSAAVFGASLNGLVTHPSRYGWNWDVLMQSQGGYGSFLTGNVQIAKVGDGDGSLDRLMARQPRVRAWSTFGFTQVPIDGQVVPVLGLATHLGAAEPPTVSGEKITATATDIGRPLTRGPNEIELGTATLSELGKHIGDTVLVGTGASARRLRIVGIVTLPSIGVSLSDHVSLGRGAMLAESTLMAIENFSSLSDNVEEAFSALPSTVAIDLDPGTKAAPLVREIEAAEPGGTPGGIYEVPQVRGAAIVNAGQMGGQPTALALALAVAVLVSLSATLVAGARRRRRELAVLQALGFTRGQVHTVVTLQALTVLVIAVVFGLPIGIAAGNWAWGSFANSLGVVPVTDVPVAGLALGIIGLVAAGTALTALPAVIATNSATARSLHNE
jgi:putative ABC transport system permease protein